MANRFANMANFMTTGREDLIEDPVERSWLDKVRGKGVDSPLAQGFRSLTDSLSGADLKAGANEFSDTLGGLGDLIKNNPEQMLSIASTFEDFLKRGKIGELAAVEAATAPFTKGDIVKRFNQALGGFDPGADIMEGDLLAKTTAERDRLLAEREAIPTSTSSLLAASEQNLQRARQRKRGR